MHKIKNKKMQYNKKHTSYWEINYTKNSAALINLSVSYSYIIELLYVIVVFFRADIRYSDGAKMYRIMYMLCFYFITYIDSRYNFKIIKLFNFCIMVYNVRM